MYVKEAVTVGASGKLHASLGTFEDDAFNYTICGREVRNVRPAKDGDVLEIECKACVRRAKYVIYLLNEGQIVHVNRGVNEKALLELVGDDMPHDALMEHLGRTGHYEGHPTEGWSMRTYRI